MSTQGTIDGRTSATGTAAGSSPGATRRGVVELTVAMLLFGTIGVFVVESGAGPVAATFFRCLIGGVAIAAWCLIRGSFRHAGHTPRTLGLAALGGVFIVANWVLFFAAYRLTSISVTTVVYYVEPFLLVLLSAVIFRERIPARSLAWMTLGFAGLVALAQPWSTGLTGHYLLGIACALGAALLYAVATVIGQRLPGTRPEITVLVQLGVGTVLLAGLVPWDDGLRLGVGWLWLVGLGVVQTGLVYTLMYASFQKLPTPLIAVLGFVDPAAAVVTDRVVYGTAVDPAQLLGIVLVLVAGLGNTALGRSRGGR